ncbi:MAG: GNAT family N-acetyltransferase [bacterium]
MTQTAGSPGITIRDLQLEDYEAVLRLWTEAGLSFRPQGRDRRDRVAAELRGGTAVFLLAEADGKLVGAVLGTHDGRKAWINRLAVAPAFRRRGTARLLVAEVEVRMAALGLDITAALIESPNQASLRFFQEIGYIHDPEIEYVSKRRSPET